MIIIFYINQIPKYPSQYVIMNCGKLYEEKEKNSIKNISVNICKNVVTCYMFQGLNTIMHEKHFA